MALNLRGLLLRQMAITLEEKLNSQSLEDRAINPHCQCCITHRDPARLIFRIRRLGRRQCVSVKNASCLALALRSSLLNSFHDAARCQAYWLTNGMATKKPIGAIMARRPVILLYFQIAIWRPISTTASDGRRK